MLTHPARGQVKLIVASPPRRPAKKDLLDHDCMVHLLNVLDLPGDEYMVGRARVFLRTAAVRRLAARRAKLHDAAVRPMQRMARGYLARQWRVAPVVAPVAAAAAAPGAVASCLQLLCALYMWMQFLIQQRVPNDVAATVSSDLSGHQAGCRCSERSTGRCRRRRPT